MDPDENDPEIVDEAIDPSALTYLERSGSPADKESR